MPSTLTLAAGLSFLVGAVHSVLGEVLIFAKLRSGGIVPTNGGPLLRERNVRILWASWHVLTVFGWGLGAILLWIDRSGSAAAMRPVLDLTAVAMMAGSALVLIGTKGRHPGWLGLLAVALLTWFSR